MKHARKAVTAASVALVGAVGAALLDGGLTVAEVIVSLGMGLTAGVATYQVPNAPHGAHRGTR